MTDFALCDRTESTLLLNWMTAGNPAECQIGQDKEGWDVGNDQLLWQKNAARLAADYEPNVLQVVWKRVNVAQGAWSQYSIHDGSILDVFGHPFAITQLIEVFFYVETAASPGLAVRSDAAGNDGWFGWRESVGRIQPQGSIMHANYLEEPVSVMNDNREWIGFQGTAGPCVVVFGALGYVVV